MAASNPHKQDTPTEAHEEIQFGTRIAVINQQGHSFSARLYVNCQNGLEGADATTICFKGKTIKGARRWAVKALNH